MVPKPTMMASQMQTRPAFRHRGLLLATVFITTAVVGIRYRANSIRTNELNQRSLAPYHVSVDRSGGGI